MFVWEFPALSFAFLSSSDTGVEVIRGRVSEFGVLARVLEIIGVFAMGLPVENDWVLFRLDSSESLLLSAVFLASATLLRAFFELFDLRRLEKLN
jgi:hypothetical protein